MVGLHALVVDDEQPVLDELVFLLGRDERIASVIIGSDRSSQATARRSSAESQRSTAL